MKRTNLLKSSKQALATFAFVAFLSSCASQKPATTVKKQEETAVVEQQTHTQLSAWQVLEQAKNLAPAIAITQTIQAGNLYLQENQAQKALWLASKSNALTEQPEQNYQLTLIEAKALLALGKITRAYEAIMRASSLTQLSQVAPKLDYYQTLASIQEARHNPVAEIDAALRAFALNSAASNKDIELLWSKLATLSQWQHQQLLQQSPPQIQGWSKLLTFANQYGADTARFQRYLTQWQREYSTHPAQYIAEQLSAKLTVPQDIENIAIIIPLSGKQERAGKVFQEGILSAYEQHPQTTLHFIDANTLDMSTLSARFSQNNIDYVIGPLLKSHVKDYLAQTDLTIPTLLLNLPSDEVLLPHQVAISMRPEDEAVQAAATLSRLNYQHPVILSHHDTLSQRIANTFSQQWQKLTDEAPEIVYFNNDAKMQNQLKASLGVDLSQQRTKELNARIKHSIKHEYRNRRDIDMIYIVGSPLETKLLKPYIDVNTSPFADIIPVFASSRSHSAKTDKSDNRDLAGLVFTSMPWQLTSKQQNKLLAKQAKKIWPNRSDSLQTIFAMGYDSLALVEKISVMQSKTYIRHYGQTGTLQLDSQNILRRSLIWGRYSRNKVQEIVMD